MSYTGKYLNINLSTGKYEVNDTDKSLLEKYIGGKGLGFALLEKIVPNPEPLSPENPLIFINGPFKDLQKSIKFRNGFIFPIAQKKIEKKHTKSRYFKGNYFFSIFFTVVIFPVLRIIKYKPVG